mmetsp:Transcript_4696/g.19140  ORF Transcript_4696/g.19140 Transcript_4696/m.19140 type:complete len:243 (+) Transcript_4696:1013-1741(+)
MWFGCGQRHRAVQRAVRVEDLVRRAGRDAGKVVEVVAAGQDAKVDEDGHRDRFRCGRRLEALLGLRAEPLEDPLESHLVRRPRRPRPRAFGIEQILHDDRRPKGEGVHVFRHDGIRVAATTQRSARRLGLARRVDDGDTHEPQQRFDVLVVLPRDARRRRRGAVYLLPCGVGRQGVVLDLRLALPLGSVAQRRLLEPRRRAIKHEDRLDARLEQLEHAVRKALDVRPTYSAGLVATRREGLL